ncbi:MAG TPA: cellulase N-terminal Ig-like domain-containing protein, partial [Verrucomicrobiota bacterium]|nr:cellulase N-terminal Ig-like domain-containing protein [Verrucomicrobiota bacterium]
MHHVARIPAVVLVGLVVNQTAGAANTIRLNSLGFLPTQAKHASVAVAATNFTVVRPSGDVVFSGTLSGPRTNVDTSEALFTADFSTFTNAGIFQLVVPGADWSAPFHIGGDIYREPFVAVTRAMY